MTLECVVNLSAGADRALVARIADAAGGALIDLHADAFHNRSVCTLATGDTDSLLAATEALAARALALVDLRSHAGVHPRLGVVDVVPFAPVGEPPFDLTEALATRQRFATFAARELALPCFFYGPERTLPELRRRAFRDLVPELGPPYADPARGACCVGAREPLVAYNLVLEKADLALAKTIAAALRSEVVRALGLAVGEDVQVSCNLVAPFAFGPAELFDACLAHAPIARAELVGLIPSGVLEHTPRRRWSELDLAADHTVESRLAEAQA